MRPFSLRPQPSIQSEPYRAPSGPTSRPVICTPRSTSLSEVISNEAPLGSRVNALIPERAAEPTKVTTKKCSSHSWLRAEIGRASCREKEESRKSEGGLEKI